MINNNKRNNIKKNINNRNNNKRNINNRNNNNRNNSKRNINNINNNKQLSFITTTKPGVNWRANLFITYSIMLLLLCRLRCFSIFLEDVSGLNEVRRTATTTTPTKKKTITSITTTTSKMTTKN
jgi:hypothetical protein